MLVMLERHRNASFLVLLRNEDRRIYSYSCLIVRQLRIFTLLSCNTKLRQCDCVSKFAIPSSLHSVNILFYTQGKRRWALPKLESHCHQRQSLGNRSTNFVYHSACLYSIKVRTWVPIAPFLETEPPYTVKFIYNIMELSILLAFHPIKFICHILFYVHISQQNDKDHESLT
jgi:hypothetical protein